MAKDSRQIQLRLPLLPEFTRLAAGMAEEAGQALGLGRGEALRLCLATEEVFAHLCQCLGPGARVELQLSGHYYYVRLSLRFTRSEVDFRLLNLAAGFSPDRPEDLERLGLLLASRAVDRFSLRALGQDQMELVLDKHKVYPAPQAPPPPVAPLAGFQVSDPGPAEIKELARLLAALYPPDAFPADFALPGKLADMALSGEYALLASQDPGGGLGGCAIWRMDGRAVQLFGPYLFGQPDHLAQGEALVDACLARVAKSGARGVICRFATPDLPRDGFELLGELSLRQAGGAVEPWPHYYRQLEEDPGAWVWCHPDLRGFLEEQYQRLFLPRGIRELSAAGETRAAHSVLSADLNRARSQATLALVWDGRDLAANLKSHLAALREEGILNVFLNLDLGSQWQAGLLPQIAAAGFKPQLLLPALGQGDLVVFQETAD